MRDDIKPVSKQNFISKSLHECKNFDSSLERRDHKFEPPNEIKIL
jgi:hypothetical protein